jgi:hypothetical protein
VFSYLIYIGTFCEMVNTTKKRGRPRRGVRRRRKMNWDNNCYGSPRKITLSQRQSVRLEPVVSSVTSQSLSVQSSPSTPSVQLPATLCSTIHTLCSITIHTLCNTHTSITRTISSIFRLCCFNSECCRRTDSVSKGRLSICCMIANEFCSRTLWN